MTPEPVVYPIPVDKLSEATATRIICEHCGAEAHVRGDEFLNDGDYACPAQCGRGVLSATFKYAEGDRCPNCKKLGFDTTEIDGCCSRPCALQWEYARALGKQDVIR